jgi:hypothetical protein
VNQAEVLSSHGQELSYVSAETVSFATPQILILDELELVARGVPKTIPAAAGLIETKSDERGARAIDVTSPLVALEGSKCGRRLRAWFAGGGRVGHWISRGQTISAIPSSTLRAELRRRRELHHVDLVAGALELE